MWSFENRVDIKKIETILFKICMAFLLVPFESHHSLCTQFMFIVNHLWRDLGFEI